MGRKKRAKRKVVKENVRRVVKYRSRDDLTPYLLLIAIILLGVGFAVYKTLIR